MPLPWPAIPNAHAPMNVLQTLACFKPDNPLLTHCIEVTKLILTTITSELENYKKNHKTPGNNYKTFPASNKTKVTILNRQTLESFKFEVQSYYLHSSLDCTTFQLGHFNSNCYITCIVSHIQSWATQQ